MSARPAKRRRSKGSEGKDSVGSYVPAGFPMELLEPEYAQSLIRECDEDYVTQARVDSALRSGGNWSSLGDFLEHCSLRETETLNHVATSGACQFSSIADQLWGRECDPDFRPDLHLRRVALELVRIWHEFFADFFLVADGTTRLQQSQGGRTVDVDDFLVRMSYVSCDGDHITLQAISDALKCRVHVLKWSPPSNVYLAAAIRPRAYLDPGSWAGLSRRPGQTSEADLNVPGRVLWLSLHGEAHFRSLHPHNITPSELDESESVQAAQRLEQLLPKTICTVCHLEVVPEGSEAAWPDKCSKRRCEKRRHVFHFNCLQQWASTATSCPSCRENFDSICRSGQPDVSVKIKPDLSNSTDLHGDKCHVCKQPGTLLCCDKCVLVYHLTCLTPALSSIPSGDWLCPECRT